MNIQRFTAPTAREALAKARLAFGDGTLILSNRQTPQGVEVMAWPRWTRWLHRHRKPPRPHPRRA